MSRPLRLSRLLVTLAAVLAFVVGACNGGEGDGEGAAVTDPVDPATSTTTEAGDGTTTTTEDATTSTTGEVQLAQSCTNPEAGYSLRYPEGWATNDGDVAPPCRFFSTGDVQVEEGTEPGTAIVVDVEPVPFARVARGNEGDEVIDRRETTIAGRSAVRIEQRASGEGLRPQGTRYTTWYVDLGGDRTFIASAQGTQEVAYQRAVEVLDRMIETLQLTS